MGILRIKDESGTFVDILAIKGEPGPQGPIGMYYISQQTGSNSQSAAVRDITTLLATLTTGEESSE